MNDKITTLNELKLVVRKFREERGWKDKDIKDNAISLVLEAVEMLELFQWQSGEKIKQNEKMREALADEMSDVLWWILSTSDGLGIDVVESFMRKHEKRGKKYPLEKFSKDIDPKERRKEYYKIKAKTRGGHPLDESEED